MFELLQINYQHLGTLSSIIGGGALGGIVLFFINRKENKRIKKSEALQSEATAKREDASAATTTMELLEKTYAHMDKMNSYNEANSLKFKKDLELIQIQRNEDHRRIRGLEKKVEKELNWRMDGDFHYCTVTGCELREPPLGTFSRNEN